MWNYTLADTNSAYNDCSCLTGQRINWVFVCGLLVGVILNECLRSATRLWSKNITRSKLKERMGSGQNQNTSKKVSGMDDGRHPTAPICALNNSEGGVQVLEEALLLFAQHMGKTRNNSKVVEYLSPEEMLKTLFSKNTHGSLSLSSSGSTQSNQDRTNQLIHCFQNIQKYSVNTNHPFFFNQLFGALDPVALAAELIALSAHTSAYTWETAPVFTMIEREVFKHLGRLVFENKLPEDDEEEEDCWERNAASNGKSRNEYDGLMLPGGALSNLTALHVARYYAKSQDKNIFSNETIGIGNDVNDDSSCSSCDDFQEEKKQEEVEEHPRTHSSFISIPSKPQPDLVAFVSLEAHYSFTKAVSVTGIGAKNLVVVPTLPNGQMDVEQLDILMASLDQNRVPFFVAATAGSTVRGSFDDIDAIVQVCRKHEERIAAAAAADTTSRPHRIWIHVDGAWGGSAIFSSRKDIQSLMKGLEHVDSFTFNPHKLIGAPQQTTAFVTRHEGILKNANSNGAKYLFDPRKHGAEYDLGDISYTCGRRTDAIKLWAQWKYYGARGIGDMVDVKVGTLQQLVHRIRENNRFMLACSPWPFNVNFFYLPERIRIQMEQCGIDFSGDNPNIPNDISQDLANVSVKLKLRLHQSGEMLIPFQPLSNQKADCFRIVLAGNKPFDEHDIEIVLGLMDQYGHDL